jgi:PAS domain S-box-containing protein
LADESPTPTPDDARLRALVDSMPMALFEVGAAGSRTFGNARFRESLGLRPDESVETGITRIIHASDRDEVVARWQAATKRGEPFRVDFRVVGPDGTLRWIRAKAVTLHDAAGAVRGYAGVLEDVSEDRGIEKALLQEAENERERSRRKSEFLAVMSHELRTPIHGVVGTAGLLQSTTLGPDQREYVEMLVQSADATLSVVNNVLDLSKIEAGRLELAQQDFALREVVEKSISLFAARAHGKGLDLACRVRSGVPETIRGDPERLRQVLVNLLSNAVKFTEKGEVLVDVSRAEAAKDGGAHLRFEVRDTGIGISESTRGRLFEPFVQANPDISSHYGGTGLGLTICRQLARLMDGTIGVEPAPIRGSKFWFTARFAPPKEPGPKPEPAPDDVRGRRVLVVDDHAGTREAVGELLRGFDVIVKDASSAPEAVEILKKGVTEYEPVDIVVLDMHLPGDGVSRGFVKSVRANDDLERVRIILMTAFGHRERAEAAKWEGIAAFLPKPVRRADLLECLIAATAEEVSEPFGRSVLSRAPAVSATGSFRLGRILIVDDNEVNRKIAVRALEPKGFLVETASNGREAVEAAKKVPYDIIFMDWMMPEMDGFEATRRIREHEKGTDQRVPIVAVTARAMEGDREKCMEPGMDDYLTKPVKFEDMDAMLEKWLSPLVKGRSGAGTPGRDAAPARRGKPQSPEDTGPLDAAVLDALAALQAEDEGDIVAELVEIFVRETDPRMERLQKAIETDDPELLMREAHGLKGTAASIGAGKLAQIAKGMEEGGLAGSVDGADALLRDLRDEYARVSVALRERVAKKKR